MENRGLLFIPDISGFTQFVNQIEIQHSRLIIQELLEILINSNKIGLEVSEIEGDAILFYKFGEPPALEDIYQQVQEMFCAFHKCLVAYDHHKFCQCTACKSVLDLTLKVVTHYGEFTGYQVKNFSKLIGKDVIVAHQLLKNDIDKHEYWLVTQNLLQDSPPKDFAVWMKWNSSAKETENGPIAFQYTQLGELKKEIAVESLSQFDRAEKTKMFSFTREYDTDIITLFHGSGDFNYRSRWWHGVKSVEEINHFLPRLGMKCKTILENGEVTTYSSSYHYQPDRIEFSETDNKGNSVYYSLEELAVKKARLTLDFYLPKSAFNEFMFKLSKKKKLEETFTKSMENLVGLLKEIKLPHVPQ